MQIFWKLTQCACDTFVTASSNQPTATYFSGVYVSTRMVENMYNVSELIVEGTHINNFTEVKCTVVKPFGLSFLSSDPSGIVW